MWLNLTDLVWTTVSVVRGGQGPSCSLADPADTSHLHLPTATAFPPAQLQLPEQAGAPKQRKGSLEAQHVT